jgi:hypothetical protein
MARETVNVTELLNAARHVLHQRDLSGRDKALIWGLVTEIVREHRQTVDLDLDESVQQYGHVPAEDLLAQFTTSFTLGLPAKDDGPHGPGKISGVTAKVAAKISKKPPKKISGEPDCPDPAPNPNDPGPNDPNPNDPKPNE